MARKPTNQDKEKIHIYVDKDVVAYFKHVADTEERPYGPLINKVLRDYVDALPPEEKYHNR